MLTSIATISGHTFFHAPVRKGGVVVDLGANRGAFARGVTELFDITCFSVEANPHLAAALPNSAKIKPFNRAITDSDGPVTFHISANSEQSSIHHSMAEGLQESVTVQGQTLESFLRENGIDFVDVMKVDIEGAEQQLFASMPQSAFDRIGQITVEFHDFLGAYPPEEVLRMAKLLKDRGFRWVKFSHTNMNWLFYRPDRCRIGLIRRLWATYFLRFVRRGFRYMGWEGPTKV